MTNSTGTQLDQQPAPPVFHNPQSRTSVLAIVALACAFLFWPVGIWVGHKALRDIEVTGERGRCLATTALVISYLGLAVGLFSLIILVATIGHAEGMGAAHSYLTR